MSLRFLAQSDLLHLFKCVNARVCRCVSRKMSSYTIQKMYRNLFVCVCVCKFCILRGNKEDNKRIKVFAAGRAVDLLKKKKKSKKVVFPFISTNTKS